MSGWRFGFGAATLALVLPFTLMGSGQLTAAHPQGLRAPITLAEHDITLDQLFAKLGSQAGVKYDVHPQGERQHVIVFCKQLPLQKLHEMVARTLLWEVSRAKDGSFRARPQPRRALISRALLQRVEEEYRSGIRAAAAFVLENGERPEVWRSIGQSKAAFVGLPQYRELLSFVGQLPDDAFRRMFAGEVVTLSPDHLPAPMRGALDRAYQAFEGPDYGLVRKVELSVPRDGAGLPEKVDVTYQFSQPTQRVHLYTGHRSTVDGFLEFVGEEYADGDPSLRSADPEGSKELRQPLPPAFPVSPSKRPLQASSFSLSLLEVHRRTGLAVVADRYVHWRENSEAYVERFPESIVMSGLTLGRAANVIAEAHGYAWSTHEQVLSFRYRDWAYGGKLEERYHPRAKTVTDPAPAVVECCQ